MLRWVAFACAFVALCPSVAFGNTINVGLISYDPFIPGDGGAPGTNFFNILNLTSAFALPPDFPVLDSLTFLNSSLTLTSGGAPLVVALGDIGPGALDATDPIQFPDITLFASAIFTGTLNQTSFLLANGSTFVAASPSIRVELLPSSGSSLSTGTDFAVIAVTDIPEPSTSLLLTSALAGLLVICNFKRG